MGGNSGSKNREIRRKEGTRKGGQLTYAAREKAEHEYEGKDEGISTPIRRALVSKLQSLPWSYYTDVIQPWCAFHVYIPRQTVRAACGVLTNS